MGEERRGGKTLSNIRLNFIVEGQTEETFVNKQLVPYLAQKIDLGVCAMRANESKAKYKVSWWSRALCTGTRRHQQVDAPGIRMRRSFHDHV